jgi:hypothetical protein
MASKKRGGGRKQTSDRVSSLAAKVLSGNKKPTAKEIKTLAGAALGQDEHKGRRGKS